MKKGLLIGRLSTERKGESAKKKGKWKDNKRISSMKGSKTRKESLRTNLEDSKGKGKNYKSKKPRQLICLNKPKETLID